jgi:hypothetical protein
MATGGSTWPSKISSTWWCLATWAAERWPSPRVGPATGQGGVQFIDVDGDYSNPLSILFAESL